GGRAPDSCSARLAEHRALPPTRTVPATRPEGLLLRQLPESARPVAAGREADRCPEPSLPQGPAREEHRSRETLHEGQAEADRPRGDDPDLLHRHRDGTAPRGWPGTTPPARGRLHEGDPGLLTPESQD